jgi:hypothetical protein
MDERLQDRSRRRTIDVSALRRDRPSLERASSRRRAEPEHWQDGDVHVTLTRVSTGDQPIANASIVGEEMHRWLRDLEGFEGFLMLSREGTTLGLTFWESSEIAEKYRVTRDEFRQRMTGVAGVEIEEVLDYQVTFAELRALMVGSE